MIEKVREFVENDRNASLKMMEEALNISMETIQIILHEDLGKTNVCAKFVPHTLTDAQKPARVIHAEEVVAAVVTKHGTFSTTQKRKVKVQNGSRLIHHKPQKHGKFHQKSKQCSLPSSIAKELSIKNSFHLDKQLLAHIIFKF